MSDGRLMDWTFITGLISYGEGRQQGSRPGNHLGTANSRTGALNQYITAHQNAGTGALAVVSQTLHFKDGNTEVCMVK